MESAMISAAASVESAFQPTEGLPVNISANEKTAPFFSTVTEQFNGICSRLPRIEVTPITITEIDARLDGAYHAQKGVQTALTSGSDTDFKKVSGCIYRFVDNVFLLAPSNATTEGEKQVSEVKLDSDQPEGFLNLLFVLTAFDILIKEEQQGQSELNELVELDSSMETLFHTSVAAFEAYYKNMKAYIKGRSAA